MKLDWGLTMIALGMFIVLNPLISTAHEGGHAYVCYINGSDFIIQPSLLGTYFACDKFTMENAELIRTQMYLMGGLTASLLAFGLFAILNKAKVLKGKLKGIGYALVTIGIIQFAQMLLETFAHDLYMQSHITIPLVSMSSLVILLVLLFRGSRQMRESIQTKPKITSDGSSEKEVKEVREVPQNVFKRDIRDILKRSKPTESTSKPRKYSSYHPDETHTANLLCDEVDRTKELPADLKEIFEPSRKEVLENVHKEITQDEGDVVTFASEAAQVETPKKKKWNMDFFVVAGVMTGLMLPARLLFVEYVSDSTFGSLGLISAISIIVVVLAKKDKLGKFGRMFERELTRLTRGKKRAFLLVWMLSLTLYFGFSIYSIDQANNVYFDEKERIKLIIIDHYSLDFEKPESMLSTLEPAQVIGGAGGYADAVVNDFEAIAITQGIMNDLSNGFLLHFHIVFLIEGMELLGVFIFYAVTYRNKKLTEEVTA